jgi:hypothetical protein
MISSVHIIDVTCKSLLSLFFFCSLLNRFVLRSIDNCDTSPEPWGTTLQILNPKNTAFIEPVYIGGGGSGIVFGTEEFALKYASFDDLKHEAQIYNRLKPLQGRDIPQVFGLFMNNSGDHLLAMQQVGKTDGLQNWSQQQRYDYRHFLLLLC